MSEDFLHFIWKYGLFDRNSIVTDSGENITIIGLGEHNADAGPDFLNSRVKIGSTVWAGNVEIHLRSSDWSIHKHMHDKAYDNVILHVVRQYDQPAFRSNGERVPTMVLNFDEGLYENYCSLINQDKQLLCQDKIAGIDPLIIDIWLNPLVIERLQRKTIDITELLVQYKNSWEEVFYIILARTFGFGLNAVPFEMTARSLPLSYLGRHRDNIRQLEALILGQAGFLNEAILFNDYYGELRNEYIHLRKKFKLKPVEKHLWKFLRLRPVNFPTVRLAQFAVLMHQSDNLFSNFLACREIEETYRLLDVHATSFWATHYTFETPSPRSKKKLGIESMNTIIINAIIPFLFIYGTMSGNEDMKERALSWLNKIPAEHNRIVNRWEKAGIRPSSAFYSQGLLQLSNGYCSRKRCLSCSIGIQVIKRSNGQ